MAQVKLSWQIEGLHDGIQVGVSSVEGYWSGVVAVLPEGTTEYTHDFLLSELEQHIVGNELVYTVSAFRGGDIRHGEPLTVLLVDSPIPELVGLGMGDPVDGLNESGLPSIYIEEGEYVSGTYGINVLVTDYNLDTEYGALHTTIGALSESTQRKLASGNRTENALNILRNAIVLESLDGNLSLSEQLITSGTAGIYLLSRDNALDIIAGDSRYTPVLNTLYAEMGSAGKIRILLDDFTYRMSGGDFNELALFGAVLELDGSDNSSVISEIQLTGEMKSNQYNIFFVQVFSTIAEA